MPYAAMQRSNYAAGDYYAAGGRSNYAAGGILSGIGRAIGGVLGTVGKVASVLPIPGAGILGGIAGAAAGVLNKSAQQGGAAGILRTASIPFNPSLAFSPVAAGGGNPIIKQPMLIPLAAGGGGAVSQNPVPSGYHYSKRTGLLTKNRRMNVTNPRALRRALRRVTGFGKLVQRSRKSIARAASATGVRRSVSRGGSRGVITRSEAARALRS